MVNYRNTTSMANEKKKGGAREKRGKQKGGMPLTMNSLINVVKTSPTHRNTVKSTNPPLIKPPQHIYPFNNKQQAPYMRSTSNPKKLIELNQKLSAYSKLLNDKKLLNALTTELSLEKEITIHNMENFTNIIEFINYNDHYTENYSPPNNPNDINYIVVTCYDDMDDDNSILDNNNITKCCNRGTHFNIDSQQCKTTIGDPFKEMLKKVLEFLNEIAEEFVTTFLGQFEFEALTKIQPQQVLKGILVSFGVDSILTGVDSILTGLESAISNDRTITEKSYYSNINSNVVDIVKVLVKTYVMLPAPTGAQTYLIKATVANLNAKSGFKNLQLFIVSSFVAMLKENVQFFDQPINQ